MQLTLLELVLKGIPEAAIFTWGLYAFSRTKIKWKKYWSVMPIIFIATYIIRLLPINYGVNTLITLILTTFLGISFIKISLFQSIKASLLSTVVVLIGEGVNLFLLQAAYGSEKTLEIIGDPIAKTINTIPSTFVFGIIIFIVYYFNVIRVKGINNVNLEQEDISSDLL
ncbi:hypothetical protein [Acetobacterium bakii]|uniref:Uncharacterized protein n=1 Tax=Acetobacterium bakii TaxID=52689 RepID=A0A0L6TZS2_9FIRM|nr:hypothetical protein [Acetobacterium bakii]KNZ41764.1 hypothetical protein AKG39_09000 [Acetobacterium bakii]